MLDFAIPARDEKACTARGSNPPCPAPQLPHQAEGHQVNGEAFLVFGEKSFVALD